jgi:deoxycytidine triphosphate deaminase
MIDVHYGEGREFGKEVYHLTPGAYILKSMEQFHMPDHIGALVVPRTTFFDAQCVFVGAHIAPGFSGYLRNLLVVYASRGIYLEREARYCAVKFYEHTLGSCDPYAGMRKGDISPTDDKLEKAF